MRRRASPARGREECRVTRRGALPDHHVAMAAPLTVNARAAILERDHYRTQPDSHRVIAAALARDLRPVNSSAMGRAGRRVRSARSTHATQLQRVDRWRPVLTEVLLPLWGLPCNNFQTRPSRNVGAASVTPWLARRRRRASLNPSWHLMRRRVGMRSARRSRGFRSDARWVESRRGIVQARFGRRASRNEGR
jgi:hypothetical protein